MQAAGLAEVLPRLAASPALYEDADGRAVEGTMSPTKIGATVLCGTLTLKENSQPLQYLRGATLSSGPQDVPVPEHQLDLDSAYAVVTRQEYSYEEPNEVKSYTTNFSFTNYTIQNNMYLPIKGIIDSVNAGQPFFSNPFTF